MTFENDPSAVIPWVVQAMKNILEAAAKRPTVKRVVLVSSSSTTYDLHPDPNGREIDTSKFYLANQSSCLCVLTMHKIAGMKRQCRLLGTRIPLQT